MKIIFDARPLDLYPQWALGGFHAGTEEMVTRLAEGLARRGHTVHVITHDLPVEFQGNGGEWWWGPKNYPRNADILVLVHSMENLPTSSFTAPIVMFATNCIDPVCMPGTADIVDAWPAFTNYHAKMLAAYNPAPKEKIYVTGLGIDLPPVVPPSAKQFGRLLWANDPQRGLWHVLDIFDHLRLLVPEATLHVAYDFDKQLAPHTWQPSVMAEVMLRCAHRIRTTPGIVNTGPLTHEELLREQRECMVHVMPSDPPNVGSQLHGITQLECAAAGAALVLSNIEAFPELFGSAASILPLPGIVLPDEGRRYDAQDWAEHVADIMCVPRQFEDMSAKSRHLAESLTWDVVLDNWEKMIAELVGE